MTARYKRILLKISGESLCASGSHGIDSDELSIICKQIKKVKDEGVEIAVVVGAGNLLRGAQFALKGGFGRAQSDYMGMVATLINGLAMQDRLDQLGCETRLMSALPISAVAETFIRRRAIRHLEKGRVVILVAGTGNPGFTTDTAAAIRAMAIDAEVLFKATTVDGVYDKDPNQHADAKKFDHIDYMEVITQQLKVMDMAAFSVCMEHDLPIVVFNYKREENLLDAVRGKDIGTFVGEKK